MRSSHLGRVLEFKRPAPEHSHQGIDLLQQQIAGIAQQQGVRGVNHVRGSEAVMNEARGGADVFRQVRGKSDDVVVSGLLYFRDARNREPGPLLYLLMRS